MASLGYFEDRACFSLKGVKPLDIAKKWTDEGEFPIKIRVENVRGSTEETILVMVMYDDEVIEKYEIEALAGGEEDEQVVYWNGEDIQGKL